MEQSERKDSERILKYLTVNKSKLPFVDKLSFPTMQGTTDLTPAPSTSFVVIPKKDEVAMSYAQH
jgi:acetone carboxylase gamma subunit